MNVAHALLSQTAALAMHAAGWDVALASHECFRPLIEVDDNFPRSSTRRVQPFDASAMQKHNRELQFIPLHGDPTAVLKSPKFTRVFYEGGNRPWLVSEVSGAHRSSGRHDGAGESGGRGVEDLEEV